MGSQGFLEYCQHQGERFEDIVLLALKMLEEVLRQECRQPLEAGTEKEMYSIPFQMYSLLVFVCLGCRNKTPQAGGLNKRVFLTVLEATSLSSRGWQSLFLLRSFFLLGL